MASWLLISVHSFIVPSKYLMFSLLNLSPSVLRQCWLGDRKGIRPVKTEWWGAGVVICSPGKRAVKRGGGCHLFIVMSKYLMFSFLKLSLSVL